jgi:hypothetical protein
MLASEEMGDAIHALKNLSPLDEQFDIIHLGLTPGVDPMEDAKIVAPYAKLGVTWWLENINPQRGSIKDMRKRIQNGPPGKGVEY